MPVPEISGQSQRFSGVTNNLYGQSNMRSTASTGISAANASAHRTNSTPLPRLPDPSQSQATEHAAANTRNSAGDPSSGLESRQLFFRINSTNPALANPGSGHTSARTVNDHPVSTDTDVTMGNRTDVADDTETGADAGTVYEDHSDSSGIQKFGDVPRDQFRDEDGDIETLCKQLAHRNQELQDENTTLLETIRAFNEKHKYAEDFEEDRRNDGIANRLKRTVRPHGDDPVRRIGVLRDENEKLKQELHNANMTANENKRRYKECSDWLDQERKSTSKLRRTLDDTRSANTSLQNAKDDAERKCGIISRENENLRRELQRTKRDLASMENFRNEIASHLNDATREAGRLSTELQVDQKVALLESRTAEIRTAETFLTNGDGIRCILGNGTRIQVRKATRGEQRADASVDEHVVFQLAVALNIQLRLVANRISNVVQRVSDNQESRSPAQVGIDALENVESLLGFQKFGFLRCRKDSTILQLCVRTALATLVQQLITSWPLPLISPLAKTVESLYEQICSNESQVPAVRWRAANANLMRSLFKKDCLEHTSVVKSTMLRSLAEIALFGNVKGSVKSLCAAFESELEVIEEIDKLLECAENLSAALNYCSSILSSEYLTFLPSSQAQFDPTDMQCDASHERLYDGGSDIRSLPAIIWAVGLGVKKRIFSNDPSSGENIALTGTPIREEILQKAQVVFDDIRND